MSDWTFIAVIALVTGSVVALVLLGVWLLVVRPHLDRKVEQLIEASQNIELKVSQGVKRGVREAFREIPETALDGTLKESTRQFRKFGSALFENGLSSFIGNADDLERRTPRSPKADKED
ncbi:hypothetical protein LPB19_11315 [Marinobacter salinisoli]|uniref:DUF948 domain-containing protein n=1 Tax=Marinobacter salinisoli TaxID=2769486 RepID=A0ABX7MQT8_9GAMM|nr:hypothetical protein [Marinobacter salinisoli]QSP93785.1 hypothetical protein LPB19_11315 [Marinobacter salinisoli]